MISRRAQRECIAQARRKWLDAAVCVEPADRRRAERAVREAYGAAGLKPPALFVWVQSPLEGVMAVAVVGHLREHADEPPPGRLYVDGTGPYGDRDWSDLVTDVADRIAHAWPGEDRASALQSVAEQIEEAMRGAGPAADVLWEVESVRGRVWQTLQGGLVSTLDDALGYTPWWALGSDERHEPVDALLGQHDVADAFRDEAAATTRGKDVVLGPLADVARSAGWWWPFAGLVVMSDRPCEAHVDNRHRLHNELGPALVYRDGFALWALHGTCVDRDVVDDIREITRERIDREANLEVRRWLIESYGHDRYFRESGGRVVHEDDYGRLWRLDIEGAVEPVMMVEVVDSTPSPDGTRRTFLLRVPPGCRTAHEAVAATFGMEPDDYRPDDES